MTTLQRPMRHAPRDYARTPLNIYWELTQACTLACRHCRAAAMPAPHPRELTPDEGIAFLRQIPEFGAPLPHLILTGGDPMARADLPELIDEAEALGIGLSITPAVTPGLTRAALAGLVGRGVQGVGLSLDGASAERHDAIRGIPGCFERTLEAIRWVGELGLPLQINTLVTAETAPDLPAVYRLLQSAPVARWSLFFLIAVGRGRVLQPLEPAAAEELMGWVYELSREAPFAVATTEAPSYRRVALERMRADRLSSEQIRQTPVYRGFGIRDGHGIVFVSSTGEICPAGFLPLPAGNVRTDRIARVYRESPLFQALHHPERFGGNCGSCGYRTLCGGSRARAYAAASDPLAADPLCTYRPN
ncbi:MAG TPA: TIGR04053 family radical SAM/SPASM domain-containing protein [Roseiflexaceae bacterium]|nr:TIGR04053 family radical SAM/SPASM domain-containing protein [Roseiflexaceae bacterium]